MGARLDLRPSGDYFMGNRTPFRWQANADATVGLGPKRRVYAGGGAALTRVRALSKVKTGYNLFFGLVSEAETLARLHTSRIVASRKPEGFIYALPPRSGQSHAFTRLCNRCQLLRLGS